MAIAINRVVYEKSSTPYAGALSGPVASYHNVLLPQKTRDRDIFVYRVPMNSNAAAHQFPIGRLSLWEAPASRGNQTKDTETARPPESVTDSASAEQDTSTASVSVFATKVLMPSPPEAISATPYYTTSLIASVLRTQRLNPRNLRDVGLDENYIGSCFVRLVMLPSDTVSEVVLGQHVLAPLRIDLLTHSNSTRSIFPQAVVHASGTPLPVTAKPMDNRLVGLWHFTSNPNLTDGLRPT